MRRAVRGVGNDGGHAGSIDDRESTDARLVADLRKRTPDAFASLHEKYAAGIYSLALRMVRHTSDAEDITQDVLIRAFERLPREHRVLLRPWLYRLTLNRCYDHFRAVARRPSLAAHTGLMHRRDSRRPTEGEPASPLDPYEQAELSRLFEATLRDLTRRQRAAMLLKDVHGLSLVEVAACLDVTPGSVEVLLARARRAFRASYEARCLAEGRPTPSSVKALALLPGLPLLPLPPALASLPPVPFAPALPIVPAPLFTPPLTLAAGSGIGAVLGLPASLKTAVLIAAAAATVGTAEVAVTSADHRPPRPAAGVTAVTPTAPAVKAPAPSASARAAARTSTTPDVAATPTPPAAQEPLASPSPTEIAVAEPQESPLGIVAPSATPEPSVAPTPLETPTAHATTAPSPFPSPSPTADVTPEPSGSPEPSGIPDAERPLAPSASPVALP